MTELRHLSRDEGARFSEGRHDVRDWSVQTRVDDHHVGTVHDVLVDRAGRARYLDIELDGGRHVLMPSGDTRIDADREVVGVPGLDRAGIATLPEYDHARGAVDDDYVRRHESAYEKAYDDRHRYERSDYRADWNRGREHDDTGTIARLDRLDDVKVASGDADPRGWEVVGARGGTIGKVDHLIGDTGAMKVRYLAVELDRGLAGEERQVLIPAGHVDLDTDSNRVRARGFERERVVDIPAWRGGELNPDVESDLRSRWASAYVGERRWEHPRYRSRLLDAERTDPTRRAD